VQGSPPGERCSCACSVGQILYSGVPKYSCPAPTASANGSGPRWGMPPCAPAADPCGAAPSSAGAASFELLLAPGPALPPAAGAGSAAPSANSSTPPPLPSLGSSNINRCPPRAVAPQAAIAATAAGGSSAGAGGGGATIAGKLVSAFFVRRESSTPARMRANAPRSTHLSLSLSTTTLNIAKVVREHTSAMTLSWGAEKGPPAASWAMRLAGTWSEYSGRAMAQLMNIASKKLQLTNYGAWRGATKVKPAATSLSLLLAAAGRCGPSAAWTNYLEVEVLSRIHEAVAQNEEGDAQPPPGNFGERHDSGESWRGLPRRMEV